MKTGKQFSLKLDDRYKTSFGTVDYKNSKSIYLNISSWALPKEEPYNWDRVISLLRKLIKSTVYRSTDNKIFLDNKILIDLDIRSSGLRLNKKSFMNCEVTLFLKNGENIKKNNVKENISSIISSIINETLEPFETFEFYPTKK